MYILRHANNIQGRPCAFTTDIIRERAPFFLFLLDFVSVVGFPTKSSVIVWFDLGLCKKVPGMGARVLDRLRCCVFTIASRHTLPRKVH